MEKKNYKAELKKTERGTYIIKMSEFYGTGYTGQETGHYWPENFMPHSKGATQAYPLQGFKILRLRTRISL